MHVEGPTILCFWLLLNFTLFASSTNAQVPSDSRLYNGREYIRNGTPAKGSPYFEWDSLHAGTLDYDGITYQLPLEYDLAQDKLVIRNYSDSTLISLVGEKTTRFSIGPYRFRQTGPELANLGETGFYQELFAGSTVSLLARKHKTLVFPSVVDEPAKYVQVDAFYVVLNGAAYKIGNQKELLSILRDMKDELKKYIRKNHLSFKRHFEESLIQTIAFYQQLKS